ncbi:ethanolamine utilization protein EutN [bacterium (Candidatus Blackallbacteria) CG17_big_fil_post_rev_8_21_14_2_50_48_46]|uniref:Ethanolamine utilization protein EutN n=1 Tax=bacterium (Candidatus Blackallbacteria) CG17_big_fil_post_rev_8_21_14_2_50_48_46 TaxID=2014261 RepID=A0A2M7FZJ1_9BACT|nr:MAG: ethanolamine utilization protein EutN [bacterium (Candidatus Blackallbacteria) CG18_big_fil_WC_8_21_14_2_50_49_26]PIW14832.1 MAG: ethanolamine utilization protein EutN [bacterium (Candidatus Blackallbacteria) CG17_big_fil_post_rev_8_21_14_2_50_48_46]PIW44399.1 MAG: ethanolamine utilization protein EutN [bacterium (Candidatus Blackallbacteria) CG13_big_fil_rev_8_21_14_2_50_49_14]
MLLGKVIGTVVASQKDIKLEGLKFQVLQLMDLNGKLTSNYVVAIDAVGAGIGEVVMYASGSSARQTSVTHNKPCDAVIMAIVDNWNMQGETVFNKTEEE